MDQLARAALFSSRATTPSEMRPRLAFSISLLRSGNFARDRFPHRARPLPEIRQVLEKVSQRYFSKNIGSDLLKDTKQKEEIAKTASAVEIISAS